ncbi:MAG: tetratricopeptide repeat protein [Melioribacteraceae bacterium]|nr:tetratricopeptide repeat protein [Melioribacteraceae bacterium]MCF8354286.1 tetratricopeptide repeat protein [Melioribacteraceae bacterium]MCF8394582.1 tetratricopeptide repeat protein [Melioribacteraceae bacterium]MCF8419749.1 tetratricopeptide repeat protein [Melioribacteraceae bacterium]
MIEKEKVNIAQDLIQKAITLNEDGKIDEAIENMRTSIEIYPTARAYIYLGRLFAMKGEFEKAITECKSAIYLDGKNTDAYSDIGSYNIELRNYEESLFWLFEALEDEHYAKRFRIYYSLGKAFEKLGRWYEAIEYYDEAVKLNQSFHHARIKRMRLTAQLN